jgi:flagellar assembly protein FliH
MTNSSNGTANKAPSARFIPREELQDFAAWRPSAFGGSAASTGGAGVKPAAPETDPAEALQAALLAARQSGYQDGYRDGLVALEGFKQSFAQQMSAQIGALVAQFQGQFDSVEQQIAAGIARAATQLARQVVRAELTTQPDLVAKVAEDAANAVLMSARHIRVHVHPDDHALVAVGAAEALSARGARLMATPTVTRGGCLIESDAGAIDARIETRWGQASALLGQPVPWNESEVSA